MATSEHDIALAARRLREGGVVAFPTETVYGLGADAMSPRAVHRVFELKGRPSNNPLIVHVSGPEMAARVVAPGAMAGDATRLARAFWPGPLSIILPKAAGVPDAVTGGGPNVAVRCPDHPVALALIMTFGGPIVGPSANLSGGISPTAAEHVRGSFDDGDVLVLDGGECSGGIESTVVSLVSPTPTILRRGLVTAAEIEGVLGKRVMAADASTGASDEPLASPGMMTRHYAPKTPTMLLEREEIVQRLESRTWQRSVVIAVGAWAAETDEQRVYVLPDDAEGYAQQMYAALRGADAQEADCIYVEKPRGSGELWLAVLDRLTRASAPE